MTITKTQGEITIYFEKTNITFVAMEDAPVILFDGVCNFCNFWVNFVIKRDRKKKLKFTTLQGETAIHLLPQ